MERERRRVHPAHRTPLSLHEEPGTRSRSVAVLATAGCGVACVALGVFLAGGNPGRATEVGVVPAAAGPAGLVVPGTDPVRPDGAVAVDLAAPGTVPVAIDLPDRGVHAPVVPTGTEPGGALAVPDPPSTVGWWSPGALAGAASGTTVLVGHVDSAAAGLGTFAVLRQVGVGEPVELRGADGRTVAYRVVARRQIGKADLPGDLFAIDGPSRLVLITCGGRFDRTTRHYTDNVIVYAEPV